MNKEKVKKYLIILLTIVFLTNIVYSFAYRIEPVVDADAYDDIAWNFAQGIGYLEDSSLQGVPELDNAVARVGPGFEFFLAVVYKIFGHHIWLIWIFHALFRVLTVFLIFLISKQLFSKYGQEIGLLAGFLFGLSPDLILLQAMLMTETLGLFLLVLSVWLSFRLIERPRPVNAFFLGSALAFATWTRPTNILIWLIMLGVLIWKRYYREALVLLTTTIIIMMPWTVRNFIIYEHFIPTSATGGYDLWVGNNPDAVGGFEKTPRIQEIRDRFHIVELETYAFGKYFQFIKEEPLRFVELQFRKTTMYFSGIRPTGWWSFLKNRPIDQIITLGASGLWTGALLLFGLSGLWVIFRRNKDLKSRLFIAFAILQPVSVIPVIVEARYRYPFFPFLAMFSAVFSVWWWKEKEIRKYLQKIFLSVLGILILMTGIDFLYNKEDIFNRINKFIR